MFCKNCGKELKDGALFCTSCGQKVLMLGSSAQSRQPEVQKPVQRVSVPKPAGKSKSGVNLILWIVVGIVIIVVAVVGYFLWSKLSNHPAEDDEVIETMEDSMPEDVQEPSDSEDDIAPSEPEEEPEETEPAGEPEEEAPEEEEVSQYFLPTSSSEYLTMSDLEGFSQDDCRMARNELYARHGRRFDDPNLQAYFDALDWYEGTIEPADFDESVMNEYEIANRDLIVQYEKDMGYRLAGDEKTVPEKLYEMSWKDTSEFSTDDFMDYLDKRGIGYAKKSSSVNFNVGYDTDVHLTAYNDRVYVKEFEPFFGGDSIVYYDTCSFESVYVICYKTFEEFEKGLKALEEDTSKRCTLCKEIDFDEHNSHFTETTKENIDICIENMIKHKYTLGITARSRDEYEEAVRNAYSDCVVCRIVSVGSMDINDDFFDSYSAWTGDSFANEVREIYSREMFEPYSYFCYVDVYYSPIKE